MQGPKLDLGGRCFRKPRKHLKKRIFLQNSIDRWLMAMIQKNNPHVAKWMHVAKKPHRLRRDTVSNQDRPSYEIVAQASGFSRVLWCTRLCVELVFRLSEIHSIWLRCQFFTAPPGIKNRCRTQMHVVCRIHAFEAKPEDGQTRTAVVTP